CAACPSSGMPWRGSPPAAAGARGGSPPILGVRSPPHLAISLLGRRPPRRGGPGSRGPPAPPPPPRESPPPPARLFPPPPSAPPAELVLPVNGDSLCEWPFRKLIRKHLTSGSRSPLLLTARPDPARFGGGVGIDRAGRILSFRSGDPEQGEVARRYVFAGAH